MGKWMDGYLKKLELIRLASQMGGGQERIDIQQANKMYHFFFCINY